MRINLADQTVTFLIACCFGAAFGVRYDFFRVFRLIRKSGKLAIFFQDIVFFVLSAGGTFVLMLARSMGEMRFYIIAGEILGFLIYFLTVGELVVRFTRRVVELVSRIAAWVRKTFFSPIVRLFRRIHGWFSQKAGKIAGTHKKMMNRSKFSLKRMQLLLYNFKGLSKKH